jgi:hypothetical protein
MFDHWVSAAQGASMDRFSVAENEAEQTRLKAGIDWLTDADLARTMSEDWTIGVGLMPLAF